jgi:hypothetical protein
MNPRSFALLAASFAGSLLIACASPADDGGISSDSAISGSLATARACAVRDAHESAPLLEIRPISVADFVAATKLQPVGATTLGTLEVQALGTVYLAEQNGVIDFYAAGGEHLATERPANTPVDVDAWFNPDGTALQCPSDRPTLGSDNRDPATCLSTAPIDQTQYPFHPAHDASPHSCTAQEAATISSYYGAHQDHLDLAAWRDSVSANCSMCVFGAKPDNEWRPVIFGDSDVMIVNRGGCIEQVSGSYACGRTYQQLQNCLVDACLKDCATQAEFTECRRDARVLTTSCKAAFQAVQTSCGENKVGAYETKCKGTKYTFEGPINVACVDGPPPTP